MLKYTFEHRGSTGDYSLEVDATDAVTISELNWDDPFVQSVSSSSEVSLQLDEIPEQEIDTTLTESGFWDIEDLQEADSEQKRAYFLWHLAVNEHDFCD